MTPTTTTATDAADADNSNELMARMVLMMQQQAAAAMHQQCAHLYVRASCLATNRAATELSWHQQQASHDLKAAWGC